MLVENFTPNGIPKREKGAATLLTVVILLIALTLIVIYAGRVTLQELRINANDWRAQSASLKAEEGLNIAISNLKVTDPEERINDWSWQACNGEAFPCEGFGGEWFYAELIGDEIGNDCNAEEIEGYCARYFSKTPDKNYASITVVSEGHTDSNNAQAEVTQTLTKYNFFSSASGRIPPVMTPTPSIGGNMTIVPNPNATGNSGQSNAISVWSEDAMAFPGSGSMQTCSALYDNGGDVGSPQCTEPNVEDEFGNKVESFNQCECSEIDVEYATGTDADGRKRPYSKKDDFGTDIVDADADFPDDMFEFFFGVPIESWQTIKDMSEIYPSCDTQPAIDDDTDPGEIIWVEGDCKLSGDDIGTRFTEDGQRGPVIMVVEGDLDVTGTEVHIWGIVFVINADGVHDTESEVKLTGTPYIHGALLSDKALDIGNGSMTVMYDAEMFNAVKASEDSETNVDTDVWMPRSGSWMDYIPAE